IWHQVTPIYAMIWVLVVAASAWACWRRPRAAVILPLAVLALMSLRVGRLVPLFGELAVCLWGPLLPGPREPATSRGGMLLEWAAILAVAIAMAPREAGRLC